MITPSNHKWHVAPRPHVQAMTVGMPKWFAATVAELADYLQQRLIQANSPAKLIEACPDCVAKRKH